ncbi:hypothetical protein ACYPKM_01225 [Pseudomonas aeruginosa]
MEERDRLRYEGQIRLRNIAWYGNITEISPVLSGLISELPVEYLLGQFVLHLHAGDTILATEIWNRRGPFDFTLALDQSNNTRIISYQGQEIRLSHSQFSEALHFLDQENEIAHLTLMHWASKGVDLTDPEAYPEDERAWHFMIPTEYKWARTLSLSEPVVKIPLFDGKTVVHSDIVRLAIAQRDGLPPKWWDDCVCIATREAVSAYPEHLLPFEQQVMIDLDTGDPLCPDTRMLRDVASTLDFEGEDLRRVSSIFFRVSPIGRAEDAFERLLVAESESLPLQAGFGLEEGRVLCRTTISFLQSFDMDVPVQLDQAKELMGRGSVVDRISAMQDIGDNFMKNIGYGRAELLANLHLPGYLECLRREMGEGALKRFVKAQAKEMITPKSFRLATEELGLKALEMLLLVPLDEPVLSDVGVVVQKGQPIITSWCPDDKLSDQLMSLLAATEGELILDTVSASVSDQAAMDGLDDVFAELRDIEDVIVSSRLDRKEADDLLFLVKKRLDAYRHIWAFRGLDRFIAAEPSTEAWAFALRLYGREALTPYWKSIPPSARVGMAGSVLSL